MSERRIDHGIALAVFLAYATVLVLTAGSLGYARDEGFYFHAAAAYRGWFELLFTDPAAAFTRANVDRFFVVNSEHPALMKLGFMASHWLFRERLGWFAEPGTAHRFAAIIVNSVGVAIVYLWGSRAYGRWGGAVAAVSFAAMPRVFHHAHLACFDLPVASLLLATAFAYVRSLETRRLSWIVATGFLYGLALDTKHNAWLFPFAVVAHLLLLRGRALVEGLRHGRLPIPPAFVAMALLGPLVLFVGWPWIWFDTVDRFAEYVRFHTQHEYYNMEFLGRTYWKPPMPRAYAWVMTLATVPAVTLLLALVGVVALAWVVWRPSKSSDAEPLHTLVGRVPTDSLWLLCVLANYAPWWSDETPIFGGTKHWIGAYPFLALLAGRGFAIALGALRGCVRAHWSEKFVPLGVAVAVSVGPVSMTARSFPWGLSFYTPGVGGATGAANAGLNRTFWGYTTNALAPVLNRDAPRGAAVYLHDTAVSSWDMFRRDARIRPDLRGTLAIQDSEFALYHHEPHMSRVEYQIWVDYGTLTPHAIAGLDGVPVVWMYRRPPRNNDP